MPFATDHFTYNYIEQHVDELEILCKKFSICTPELQTDINLETVPEDLEDAIAVRNLLYVVLYHVPCKGKFYKIKEIFHSSGSRFISHNQTHLATTV